MNEDVQEAIGAMRESIADVLATECDSRRLHAFIDGKNDVDAVLLKHAAELGWLAAGIPETQGGLGLGVRGLAILHQELGRRAAPGPFISTLAAAQTLVECADNATREEFLPRVAGGELAICVPAAPLAEGGAANTLTLDGNALRGRASQLLGAVNASAALVPFKDGNATAWGLVEIGAQARLSTRPLWDPTRALCDVECDGAPVRVVAQGDAANALRDTLAMHMALAVTYDSVGGAEAILAQTIEYMKTRVQFDRVIASFQALKHRAATLHIEAELARHSAAQALDAADAGQPDRLLWASMSKAAVTDAYALIAGDAVQLHGGVGYTWEFDCHLYQKRSRLNQALVAGNDAHLDRAAGDLAAATRDRRSVLDLPLELS